MTSQKFQKFEGCAIYITTDGDGPTHQKSFRKRQMIWGGVEKFRDSILTF